MSLKETLERKLEEKQHIIRKPIQAKIKTISETDKKLLQKLQKEKQIRDKYSTWKWKRLYDKVRAYGVPCGKDNSQILIDYLVKIELDQQQIRFS